MCGLFQAPLPQHLASIFEKVDKVLKIDKLSSRPTLVRSGTINAGRTELVSFSFTGTKEKKLPSIF